MRVCTVDCNMAINGIIDKVLKSASDANMRTVFGVEALNGDKDFQAVFYQWPNEVEKGKAVFKEISDRLQPNETPAFVLVDKLNSIEAKTALSGTAARFMILPLEIELIKRALFTEDSAAVPNKTSRESAKAEYINPFIEATIYVISQVTGATPVKKSLSMVKHTELRGDFSGVLGFAGQTEGFIILVLNTKLASEVVARMLSTQVSELTEDDIRDGIGELTNMVSGNAKTSLANTPYHFELSIPTVVVGASHKVGCGKDIPCITVDFDVLDETFSVAVALKPQEGMA